MSNGILNEKQFLAHLKTLRKKNGQDKPLTRYAKELRVSFQFLSKVLQGHYAPGPKIAKALGYEQVKTVTYKPLPAKPKAKAKGAGAK